MQRSAALPVYWFVFIFMSDNNQVKEDDLRMSHIRSNSLTKILILFF